MKNKLTGDKDDKKKAKPIPVKIVSDTIAGSTASPGIDKKWRAEQDLRDLSRANEIRGDKQRMKAAQELAKAQLKSVSK